MVLISLIYRRSYGVSIWRAWSQMLQGVLVSCRKVLSYSGSRVPSGLQACKVAPFQKERLQRQAGAAQTDTNWCLTPLLVKSYAVVGAIAVLVWITLHLHLNLPCPFKGRNRNTFTKRWSSKHTRKESQGMDRPATSQTINFMYFFLGEEGEMRLFKKLHAVGCKEIVRPWAEKWQAAKLILTVTRSHECFTNNK